MVAARTVKRSAVGAAEFSEPGLPTRRRYHRSNRNGNQQKIDFQWKKIAGQVLRATKPGTPNSVPMTVPG